MYDILIIGGGPAGLSASIYGARAQLKTAVFGDPAKGNLHKAHLISNYFGFPKGISGADLCAIGLAQAKSFGAEHFENEIIDISIGDDLTFTVKDDKNRQYSSKTLILATGQSFTLSGIKNEKELTGKGVSYCVTCDGFFFRGKKVVVIGNGNYAGEEALQLLAYTKDITILSHGRDFSFSEEISRELTAAGLKTQRTERIKEITGEGRAEKLIFSDGVEMPVEGVFMAAGVAGATAFAKKLGLETAGNYIKIDQEGKTNLPGIFAAGDCTGSPAQVASSVGAGCNAALSAIKLLRGAQVYVQYG